jgi:hypothetical protein
MALIGWGWGDFERFQVSTSTQKTLLSPFRLLIEASSGLADEQTSERDIALALSTKKQQHFCCKMSGGNRHIGQQEENQHAEKDAPQCQV